MKVVIIIEYFYNTEIKNLNIFFVGYGQKWAFELSLRDASILDVAPASRLNYSKTVEVLLIDGIIDNPALAPQMSMEREKELKVNVEMIDGGGDVHQTQLETDGLEQNGESLPSAWTGSKRGSRIGT